MNRLAGDVDRQAPECQLLPSPAEGRNGEMSVRKKLDEFR